MDELFSVHGHTNGVTSCVELHGEELGKFEREYSWLAPKWQREGSRMETYDMCKEVDNQLTRKATPQILAMADLKADPVSLLLTILRGVYKATYTQWREVGAM